MPGNLNNGFFKMPVPKGLCTGTLNYGAMIVVFTGPELKLDTLLTAVSENV